MHLTEAIHSSLAMAPMREHSPHNNELLRLPEDTMPVQRIEIKRQVRCGEDRWGKGGRKGRLWIYREQMWGILCPEWIKRSSIGSKCWIKVHMMGIKLQLKRQSVPCYSRYWQTHQVFKTQTGSLRGCVYLVWQPSTSKSRAVCWWQIK